jgi:hypothetical protein
VLAARPGRDRLIEVLLVEPLRLRFDSVHASDK